MTLIAILSLALAAILGLILASRVLKSEFAPWPLSLLHALFGAVGLVLLIATILTGSTTQILLVGTGVLVVAALGGFFLASLHLKKSLAPKGVVILHAGLAVIGFLLIVSTLL